MCAPDERGRMSLTSYFGRRAAVTVLASAAAVLLSATAAQAAVPSGSGWSASWRYYTTDSFEFAATLPGVKAAGHGVDVNGERGAVVTLTDTANDSRCARVVMAVPGWGTLGSQTICTAGESASVGDFDAQTDGYLYVTIYRMYMFGGGWDKITTLVIPPSKDDAGLRTVNTGTSWKYTSGTTFTYEVRRPGVFLTGTGHHQGDSRSAWSAVQDTSSDIFLCASGKVSGPGASTSGQTCATNGIQAFNEDGFTNGITVEACSVPAWSAKRCLSTTVSKPL
jgi:hypothetical protein